MSARSRTDWYEYRSRRNRLVVARNRRTIQAGEDVGGRWRFKKV